MTSRISVFSDLFKNLFSKNFKIYKKVHIFFDPRRRPNPWDLTLFDLGISDFSDLENFIPEVFDICRESPYYSSFRDFYD